MAMLRSASTSVRLYVVQFRCLIRCDKVKDNDDILCILMDGGGQKKSTVMCGRSALRFITSGSSEMHWITFSASYNFSELIERYGILSYG